MLFRSEYVSGKTTCPNGEVGTLALVSWANADDPDAAPTVITKDIAGTRFVNDRMAMTLAFVPEAAIAEVPRPESIPNLDNLSDVPGAGQDDLSGLGDTTGLGDTSSTVLDPTASTVVATASTVAAPASTVAATTPTTKG